MSEQLLHELRPPARPPPPRCASAYAPCPSAGAGTGALSRPAPVHWGWRRLVLVAPATVAVALVAAGVIGLTRGDVARRRRAGRRRPRRRPAPPRARHVRRGHAAAAPERRGPPRRPTSAGDAGAAVRPRPASCSATRPSSGLRVDDVDALSSATKRAQRIALAHGGSVASLQYDAPAEGVGAAQITFRIPTAKVQSALAELSALGTIVGQRYGIDDLQQQADTLQREIEATQRRIAGILAQLESPNLSNADRAVLQSRLSNARAELTRLRQGLERTRAEARTATVYLTLTTEEIEPGAVGGGSQLDGVKDVLAWEAIALLYAAVIRGPFLVVGFLVPMGLRLLRRRETARLLAENC